MRSKLTRLTTPSADVVTLQQVKDHLKIDGTDSDTYLGTLISTAVELVYQVTGRQLLTCNYRLDVDSFRDIELPKPPFNALISITYKDENGDTQTLSESSYSIDDAIEPAVISFANDLPNTQADVNLPISISYTTGYADADAIPAMIKHYTLMVVGTMFDTSRTTNSEYALHHTPMADALIRPFIVTERGEQ